MRHRTLTLKQVDGFKLTSSVNKKTGSKHFIITMDPWARMSAAQVDVAALFDPFNNRGIRGGYKWKFKSREEAEYMLTIAILKWSE
jgi:hypothetical protein